MELATGLQRLALKLAGCFYAVFSCAFGVAAECRPPDFLSRKEEFLSPRESIYKIVKAIK